MMFIDVTRFGGLRVMRVAVAAIAYLDTVEGGCALHLIGGETIRVNEDPAEIEERVASIAPAATVETNDRRIETAPPIAAPVAVVPVPVSVPIVARSEVDRYPAKRGTRGRNGR